MYGRYFFRPAISYPVFWLSEKHNNMKTLDCLTKVENMSKWSKDEIVAWQEDKLKKLIRNAYYHTTFYKERFQKNKLHPNDIKHIGDLVKLPYLSKEDILAAGKSICNITNRRDYYYSATGGSTGSPLQFYISHEAESYIQAIDLYFKNGFGYKYGTPTLVFGASSLKIKKHKNTFQKLNTKIKGFFAVDVMSLDESKFYSIADLIVKENIQFIYGYASAIFLFAKFCLENGIAISVQTCFPTSEILTDYYRDTILQAFKCKILNGYGARDGGVLAYEVEPNEFRVGYNSIIEVMSDEQLDGNSGAIICTDIFNDVFPFIRYSLGDEIIGLNNESKAYNGQIFATVIGRSSNVIKLKNKRYLTGPGFTVLFQNVNVRAYQIEQISDEKIVCRIVKMDNFTIEDETKISSVMKSNIGNDIKYEINYLDKIEKTQSGKCKYFIVR